MFHSMVRRTPITVRDSVNLIPSGQEQRLKNDKLISSWIKVKCATAAVFTLSLGAHFDLQMTCLHLVRSVITFGHKTE